MPKIEHEVRHRDDSTFTNLEDIFEDEPLEALGGPEERNTGDETLENRDPDGKSSFARPNLSGKRRMPKMSKSRITQNPLRSQSAADLRLEEEVDTGPSWSWRSGWGSNSAGKRRVSAVSPHRRSGSVDSQVTVTPTKRSTDQDIALDQKLNPTQRRHRSSGFSSLGATIAAAEEIED